MLRLAPHGGTIFGVSSLRRRTAVPQCAATAPPSSTGRTQQQTRSQDAVHSIITRELMCQLAPPKPRKRGDVPLPPLVVLRGVNLRVTRGAVHMLLGPNGCGKSTLLKVLGGLVPAAGGAIDMDGPCSFVFQNPDHQVVMPTVAADVAFGLGRYKIPEESVCQSVVSALELVNMQESMHRANHTLSGGQRQRVAIAGALAEGPRVLLLDELTTFLDVEDQFGVLGAVRGITRANHDVTAVWVTHRFEELEFADEGSYMEDGRIVFSGSPEELKAHLRSLGATV